VDDETEATTYALGPGGPLDEETRSNVTFPLLQDLGRDTVITMRGTGKKLTGPDPASSAGTTRTWSYGYDGAGNRTSFTVAGTTTTYALDEQGWPSRVDPGTPGNTSDDTLYAWDEAGNLEGLTTPTASTTFTTDAWGWITAASVGGASVGYTLDAFGRVLTRTEGGTPTQLTYEGISEDLQTSSTGGTLTSYAYTPGGPLAQKVGGGAAEFYLRDLHSDVSPVSSDLGSSDGCSSKPRWWVRWVAWGPVQTTPRWSRSSRCSRRTCSTVIDGAADRSCGWRSLHGSERTYHRRRRQRALGKLTPIEFETIFQVAYAA